MQSSRSKSCASQRKGRLLRLQSKQQSYFRWRWAKAWKLCLAWFWIDHNQSLQPSWLQMPVKRDVESHVETCIDWTSFDFWFEDLIEICLWKYSSTGLLINHMKLISKICLTFKLSVITILLLNEHWAKNVPSENNSTPLYVQCDIINQLKVCCQEFLYMLSGLDIQLEQSNNDNPSLQTKNCFKVAICNKFFFNRSIQTHYLVVKAASCSEWHGFPAGWQWMLKLPAAILSGTEPVSACYTLLIGFLGIRSWWSRPDRVSTLDMKIRLPLFWNTWSRVRGMDSVTYAGLVHGRDYSIIYYNV